MGSWRQTMSGHFSNGLAYCLITFRVIFVSVHNTCLPFSTVYSLITLFFNVLFFSLFNVRTCLLYKNTPNLWSLISLHKSNYCLVRKFVKVLIWWFGGLENLISPILNPAAWLASYTSTMRCTTTSRNIPVHSPGNVISGILLSPERKLVSLMSGWGVLWTTAPHAPRQSRTTSTHQRRRWGWEGMAPKMARPRLLDTSLSF